MNIAFYFNNNGIIGQDYSQIKEGNPGIGGTQYAMILLATFFAEKNHPDKNFFLFAESAIGIPQNLNVQETSNYKILSKKIEDFKIDILVVNKIGKNTLDKNFFSAIKRNDVKVIIWDHCFIPYWDLVKYAKNKKVARIIAVGKEQLLTWCDHSAFKKSSYIYNIFNYSTRTLKPFSDRENNVVYVGSIVSLKGLHLLTKAWPKVLKEIPDANLYIIGGGNLYNKNVELGKFGIAEYFYEKELLKPILGDDGQILPSVHFCGVMGTEKFDILNNSKVGVPNPSGLTETFGFTAIEMQLAGCLVTTMKCPGYLDTVDTRNSLLYDDTSKLATNIIQLLRRKTYEPDETISFIHEKFSIEKILNDWMIVFDEVYNQKYPIHKDLHSSLKSSQLKIKNQSIQKYAFFIPSLMLYETTLKTILYVLKKVCKFPETIHKLYRRNIYKKNKNGKV